MNRLNFKFLGIMFIFLFSFSINDKVYATQIFTDLGASGGGGYNGRGSGNGSFSTWNGNDAGNPVLGYRITLVGPDGRKIDNTDSVDVVKSNNADQYYVLTDPTATLGAKHMFGTTEPYYKYRFADRVAPSGHKYGASNITKYKFLAIPDFPTKIGDLDSFIYNNIIAINTTDLVSHRDPSIYKYKAIWHGSDTTINVDFVSFILHQVGYLKDTDPDYFDVNRNLASGLNNNYLIFEPLYVIKFNGSAAYGTTTEIVERMKQGITDNNYKNLLWGMWGTNEVSKFACGSYDKSSSLVPNHMDSGDCWANYYCGRANGCPNGNNAIVYNMLDLDWGFGYRPVSMNFGFTPDPPRPDVFDSYYTIDLCKTNDFFMYFRVDANHHWSNVGESLQQGFFKTGGVGPQRVFCYDEATYNFSNILSTLRETRTIFSDITVPNGTLTVLRTCYSELGDPNFETKIKNSYLNNMFTLNFNGTNYTLKPTYLGGSERPSSIQNVRRFQAEFSYGLDNPTIHLDFNSLQYNSGYLDLRNFYDTTIENYSNISGMFGASNQLINKFYHNGVNNIHYDPVANKIKNYFLSYNDGQLFSGAKKFIPENLTCSFDYQLKNYDPQIDFEFRTISLDHPFPARDGSTRLPGRNWLDKENNVYEYITNNRGIRYQYNVNHSDVNYNSDVLKSLSPETMYNEVQPMYTITLTPSTMRAIRDYNKLFDYRSMYSDSTDSRLDHLRCKDNGTECYSEFLRDSRYIPQNDIDGDCVLVKNTTDGTVIRNTLNRADTLPSYSDVLSAVEAKSYRSDYDLNKNLRIDTFDAEIAKPSHAGMNTKYYTCANKTFYSGGPVDE